MSLAIDFVGTNLGSGTKTYNINFCKEIQKTKIKKEIFIFICKDYLNQIGKVNNNLKIKYIIKPNFLSNIILRIIWMQLILPFELKLLGVKKLFSPMNFCPLLCNLLKVDVTLGLHSNLPWVYFDLMPGNLIRKYLTKKLMEYSISISKKILIPSYFAQKEICKLLKIKKDKVKVIHLGIDEKYFNKNSYKKNKKQFTFKKKYIFSVISCVKYHNILNLLKAYRLLIPEIGKKIQFVIVMPILDTDYFKIIKMFINKNFKKKQVILLSAIKSEELPSMYKNSGLYIFSSYCEVFGFTSLEAMSQKCPVMISRNSSLPEINGKAAMYFNSDNVFEIKNKLKKIIKNNKVRKNLIKKGSIHCKKFTWKQNIHKTLKELYL